ncbi:hypothetical protein Dform_01141 [Dehalogenimonas formicexedens]|uniref:Uncharacterized protein n=1 Tax=Dehalogenimonas formicexedens TaxID=1839801 RepID=A0A1P8F7Q9_9CHLR|nr:RuvA C-terminal domain-containing protein [Dehalogenimonas formicexedens]APV44475.1 hypothetical protein Dform_01141 [Dehalogenimonas formicexedens]
MAPLIDINDDHGQQERSEHMARLAAEKEAAAYFANIKKASDNFKVILAKEKEPEVTTPQWLRPYSLDIWGNIPFPPKDWMTDETKIKIALKKATLPSEYGKYVNHRVSHKAFYIPRAFYEAVSLATPSSTGHHSSKSRIPSLVWEVGVHIISTIDFHETPGVIRVPRYDFTQQIRCVPECLGEMYAGPEFWSYQKAFITPVLLLAKLAWGKEKMPGVDVVRRVTPWTRYEIESTGREFSVHDDFARLLQEATKKASLDKALLNMGICDVQTAQLIKVELERLKALVAQSSYLPVFVKSEDVCDNGYVDLMGTLAALGFPKAEAAPVAKQVCQKYPEEPLEKKVAIALQLLGR